MLSNIQQVGLLILFVLFLSGVLVCFLTKSKYFRRKRIRRFIELWKEKSQSAIDDFQNDIRPATFLNDTELSEFESKYFDLRRAVFLFKYPHSSDLISEDLDWIEEIKTIFQGLRSFQLKINSQYFIDNSRGLKDEYLALLDSQKYVPYHQTVAFKKKWENFIKLFKSQKSLEDYKDYLPEYKLFIDVSILLSDSEYCNCQREKNNAVFITNELEKQSDFFETLFNYPLDKQQREAIVTLEDNTLVVSSAGSGKTSVIVGKVRYLVEKKDIKPEEILVLTYTRKAAAELRERMGIAGITSSTFHKHALDTLGFILGSKPSIVAKEALLNIFDRLIKTDREFLKSFNKLESEYSNLTKNDHDYRSSLERMDDIQKYGLRSPYKDGIGNLRIMKSKQEVLISIILTHLGVDYRYEEPYIYDTSNQFHRKYRPDFVIHYNTMESDSNGKERRVEKILYLEHFGIDSKGETPKWFGDGIEGGWNKAQQTYINAINWKREVHKQYGTTLIETTSADFEKYSDMEEYLETLLNNHGVPTRHITEEEKRLKFLECNSGLDKSLFEFIAGFIILMKANRKELNDIINQIIIIDKTDIRNRFILSKIIKPLFNEYEQYLTKTGECDFTDILLKASELCNEQNPYNYRYILIDEFQDISMDKYLYLKSLRKQNPFTSLFCVGDDWQSIYRFSGSDMTLFSDFANFFGHTKECKIETTHRFGQPLLNASTEFILANPEQKVKHVKTTQKESTHIKFIPYETDGERGVVEKIIDSIPINESVLILGRYNFSGNSIGIKSIPLGTKERVVFKTHKREIPYLTVHSSKGLEADNVILIDCIGGLYGFPSQVEDDPIMAYVLSGTDSYDNAEERRLFYVGVTRAKKCTYCLFEQDNPSPFLKEFGEYNKQEDSIDAICPRCHSGYIRVIRAGSTRYGVPYITVNCTNQSCDYFENLFGESIQKYQSRQSLGTWSLDSVYKNVGVTGVEIKANGRVCVIYNDIECKYIPLYIHQSIVANDFLIEELRRNSLKYEVSAVLFSNVTIYVLKKRSTTKVFATNSELEFFIKYSSYYKEKYSRIEM